jgi:hypothetical protein
MAIRPHGQNETNAGIVVEDHRLDQKDMIVGDVARIAGHGFSRLLRSHRSASNKKELV